MLIAARETCCRRCPCGSASAQCGDVTACFAVGSSKRAGHARSRTPMTTRALSSSPSRQLGAALRSGEESARFSADETGLHEAQPHAGDSQTWSMRVVWEEDADGWNTRARACPWLGGRHWWICMCCMTTTLRQRTRLPSARACDLEESGTESQIHTGSEPQPTSERVRSSGREP